jgi:processive 1,2-diacylglycerol beta-glucosyltransferase
MGLSSSDNEHEVLRRLHRPRVLILYAKFGGGHKSSAEALAAWFRQHIEGEVTVLDHFEEFVSPVMTQAALSSYTQSVRLFPRGYHMFYESTRRLKPDSRAQQWLNNLGREGLEAFLERTRPDLIVSVHPTPAGVLSDMRREGRLSIPFTTVLTDYAVHSQWVHPFTDLYLVGSEEVRLGLIEVGAPPERIRVTGIPIRVNTDLLEQREELRAKWGLGPEMPTVLVMTGAQGLMRRPWRLFHTVASRPVQGFFLCGKDRALQARLQLVKSRYPHFRVLPFVRVVPELMCVADLLVSKAGGLTTSEALAMELPMLIFHPIPGQEYSNRDYLVEAGAAVSVDDLPAVGTELDRFCAAPERLAQMREAIRQIRRPHATRDAWVEMFRLLVDENRCRVN